MTTPNLVKVIKRAERERLEQAAGSTNPELSSREGARALAARVKEWVSEQVYASHFRANGFDADDPALIAMAARMGGEPTIVAGQREYWAETYALRYLLSRLRPGKRRELLRLVRKSLTAEAAFYLPSLTEWQTLTSFN